MTDSLVDGSLLDQGLMLLAFGMGTVFLFLGLLVFSTSAMSRVITRFFPEAEIEPVIPRSNLKTQHADGRLISIVSAAIHQYRKDRKK